MDACVTGEVLIHVGIDQLDIKVTGEHCSTRGEARPHNLMSTEALRHYVLNRILIRCVQTTTYCSSMVTMWNIKNNVAHLMHGLAHRLGRVIA